MEIDTRGVGIPTEIGQLKAGDTIYAEGILMIVTVRDDYGKENDRTLCVGLENGDFFDFHHDTEVLPVRAKVLAGV